MKVAATGGAGGTKSGRLTVLVTGAKGFIGRHLVEALGRRPDTKVIEYDVVSPEADLDRGLRTADVIFHLAGVNRPEKSEEFLTGNVGFTETLCQRLEALGRRPLIVMSSSIQAVLDNPYGRSKRQAEELLERWARGRAEREASGEEGEAVRGEGEGQAGNGGNEEGNRQGGAGGRVIIFRLKNVFGKWCRPNYNSVTATFCYNIAHDLPITISDPKRELELVYIDDVIEAFLGVLGECEAESGKRGARSSGRAVACEFREVGRSFKVTLGEVAARIQLFRESRRSLVLPDFSDPFNRCLYATYLSYLDGPEFVYALEQKTDPRGALAEFVKSPSAGQIFVSRTKAGVTRGNHYHHTKTEKFLVLEGEAIIRFRQVSAEQGAGSRERGAGDSKLRTPNSELPAPGSLLSAPAVIEHRVSGHEFKVVDIPPGYTHSIENVGSGELVTLFWASEVFDPARPDTYFENVLR